MSIDNMFEQWECVLGTALISETSLSYSKLASFLMLLYAMNFNLLNLTEVMHAKLSNAVGGRVLDLKFPIGACVYNDGLVVCNSGDNTVLYFQYKNDGSIPNKTYIQVSVTSSQCQYSCYYH